MMAVLNEKSAPGWRNFAAWSGVGAGSYILVVGGISSVVHEDAAGAMLRSREVIALLTAGLIVATAATGFSSRKQPVSLKTLRNFMIRYGAAVIVCLLVMWGLSTLAGAAAMGASEWAAAVTGAVLVFLAVFGALATASVHTGADLIDDELAVEEMRERGRLLAYGFVWTAACGVLLIVLGLAGPGGVLSPAPALASVLVLTVVLALAGRAVWRLADELDRTLSYEAGNMAFYLILGLGGGWAMLAHLGFVAGPAPLDWLTMLTVLLFAASFIAVGRRNLLTR